MRLVGRLEFAASQMYARVGAAALWHLRRRSTAAAQPHALTPPMRAAMICWLDALKGQQQPRVVKFGAEFPPAVVFSDGCCEPAGTGRLFVSVGAIILDMATGTFEAFGCEVPSSLVDIFPSETDSNQVIAQAEILPVLAAKLK